MRLALDYGRAAKSLEVSVAQKERATQLHYRALAVGPAQHELQLRRRLGELLIETGRFAAAEKEAQRVPSTAGPSDAQGLRLLSLALVRQLADGSLAGKKTEELELSSYPVLF